jgi:hypothetical protein
MTERPTREQIAGAKAKLEGVTGGTRLTPEQIDAQMLLSACRPGCTCEACRDQD